MENYSKKILFLHGFTQNSIVIQKRLKVLTKAIEQNFPNLSFLFPDAPFILEEHNELLQEEEIKRGWLYLNNENKMECQKFQENEVQYLGLETSLNYLSDLAKLHNNIECIFGFSQGALISIFISALIQKGVLNNVFPNLKCIILVSGFFHPFPLNEELKSFYIISKSAYETNSIPDEEKIKIPVLNVYGEKDEFIIPTKSEKVNLIYENSRTHVHKGKHFIPTSKDDLEVFINFLEKFFKP
jgi:predicted esterase